MTLLRKTLLITTTIFCCNVIIALGQSTKTTKGKGNRDTDIARDSLILIQVGNKYGFTNDKGEDIIPTIYDKAYPFESGLSAVRSGRGNGFIDKKGTVVIPLVYDMTGDHFSSGLVNAQQNRKWGYIDEKGKTVIPFTYEDAWVFREELACVSLNGKYGFIDKTGKVVVPLQYDITSFVFNNGLSAVSLNGRWGVVNTKGKEVVPAIYDEIVSITDGKIKMTQKGVSYIFDKNGKPVK